MRNLHLYVLAAALTIAGLGLFAYKAVGLRFPLSPYTEEEVWNVQAHVVFTASGGPVKLSMFIPSGGDNFAVIDEKFISRGYGLVASPENGNRLAAWSIRSAVGRQSLYYQATILRAPATPPTSEKKGPHHPPRSFQGPELEAAKAIIEELTRKSADTPGMVSNLIRMINEPDPMDTMKSLLGPKPTAQTKAALATRLVESSGTPARLVRGVHLQESHHEISKKTPVLRWLEVYYKKKWVTFDLITGVSPAPGDRLPWWKGSKRMVTLEGGADLGVTVSISPKLEQGVAAALKRGEVSKPLLVKFSLFSLPVDTQAVYRVMLMIPVGAFLLALLRNVVGIKTFGTFMPVLIGVSFRETGLLWGIVFFALTTSLGLAVRFYLERLRLLVTPRLSAILIVVLLIMAGLSVLSHKLGFKSGLSVALFPMVILTMTIERMTIVWEERGGAEALISGLGSILTAALAFLVMNIKPLEHLVFVFPELLLVLLAANLLLGRYSGYRLTDLARFKALTAE